MLAPSISLLRYLCLSFVSYVQITPTETDYKLLLITYFDCIFSLDIGFNGNVQGKKIVPGSIVVHLWYTVSCTNSPKKGYLQICKVCYLLFSPRDKKKLTNIPSQKGGTPQSKMYRMMPTLQMSDSGP
jgi:hypothetical protein